MKLTLRFNTMPHKPLCMNPRMIGALVIVLITVIIPAMPTASLGSTEEREKHAPRSSVYKGEVVAHEATKLIMKDSNGQRIELHLGADTLIQGRPGHLSRKEISSKRMSRRRGTRNPFAQGDRNMTLGRCAIGFRSSLKWQALAV